MNEPKPNITAESLVALVRKRDHVSFAELRYHYADVDGDLAFEKAPNIAIWNGGSKPLFDAYTEAVRQGQIHLEPCNPIVYFIDGAVPGLPVLKRWPKEGTKRKRPCWIPVVMRPGKA